MELVYSLFPNEERAKRAVEELVENEFAAANIYVLMRGHEASSPVEKVPVQTKTLVGPGVALGAALGAVGGALVALGGGLLTAGPLVAVLSAVALGGAAGTLVGTLGGLGYWRDVAEFPVREVEADAILVGVDLQAQGQALRAAQALKDAGAGEVHIRPLREAKRELEHA